VIQSISTNLEETRAALAGATGGTTATPGRDFRTLHAAAVARAKDAPDGPAAAASEKIEVPEGETWASAKPGAHYARIVSGPRAGQYINLTHGDRRGQTFTIENRDGKDVHVYSVSGEEVVIKPAVDARDVSDAARRAGRRPSDQPRAGEQWAPVEGHSNYADILGGKRNGLYVNISGGIRDGMAFQIVKKGDKVFHVYGTGKDKQMIQVAPKDKAETDSKTSDSKDASAAAGGTGGAAAPTQ
jgi:hypothetical protein